MPDAVAFHPWMSVRETLEYAAPFRPRWNESSSVVLGVVGALAWGLRAALALIVMVRPPAAGFCGRSFLQYH